MPLSPADKIAVTLGIAAILLLWYAGGFVLAVGVFLALWANNIAQGCICRRP